MIHFEDPIQFEIMKNTGGTEIAYSNLMEIAQGGPEVGSISINGNLVKGRFGGPAIVQDNYVYLPAYIKKFFGTGFRLARINIDNLEVKCLSKSKDLIFLDKIEGNKIYFFEDLNKTVRSYFEI